MRLPTGKIRFFAGTTASGDDAERSTTIDSLNDIIQRGAIRVAVPQDFAPFGSVDAGMRLRGLDIDVATLIARDLNIRLTMVPVTSAQRVTYLQTGAVDLVISSLGKDAAREHQIDFSQAYAPFNNSVFGPASLAVRGPQDLAGKIIGVTRGAIEDRLVTDSAPELTQIKRFNNNNALIDAYRVGEIELIGTGDIVAMKVQDSLPSSSVIKPTLKYLMRPSACYIGMNKDTPALRSRIDAILDTAHADGTLRALCQKWLPASLYAAPAPARNEREDATADSGSGSGSAAGAGEAG